MSLARLLVAVPDIALGAAFLATWLWPSRFGARTSRYVAMALVLEFVVIHSAVLIGKIALGTATKQRKTTNLLIAGVAYTLFLAALAARFGQWWTVVAFWLLIGNRLGNMLLNPTPTMDLRKSMEGDWARSIGLFVIWGAATSMLVSDRDRAYVIILGGYYWSQAFFEVKRAALYAFGPIKSKRRVARPKLGTGT